MARQISEKPLEELTEEDRERFRYCQEQLWELRECYHLLVDPDVFTNVKEWVRRDAPVFVDEIIAAARLIARFQDVPITFIGHDALQNSAAKLHGDARILRIPCRTLVNNAIKAVRLCIDGGKCPEDYQPLVAVNFSIRDERLVVEVHDNGVACTLTEDELFSLHRSGWDGLGIGLHSAQVICKQFHGNLDWDGEKMFSTSLAIEVSETGTSGVDR